MLEKKQNKGNFLLLLGGRLYTKIQSLSSFADVWCVKDVVVPGVN